MKRIMRWCIALALTIAVALAATLLAPPTIDAQSEPEPTVACTIHVFAMRDCEHVRIEAVADMVGALESYAAANGTYLVEGSGYLGRGSGWAFWELAGTNYPVAIATVLTNQGHLPTDAARDPLWASSGGAEGDMLVYRCKDRVAVFTPHGTSTPLVSDRDWWANNGCTTYPITGLNATYFQVSAPLSLAGPASGDDESLRVDAVSDMVSALESYAAVNGTYLVDGAGYLGRGSGWTFWELAGTKYPVAIAAVLTSEGHLPADAARDPLWSSSTAIEGDVLVYRCKDRVAVFTRHSTSTPSASDRDWWANNGCTTYPITGLSATYYEISRPLPAQ